MRKTSRAVVAGVLALTMGAAGTPLARADRSDPHDRGILEHQVPVEVTVKPLTFYPIDDGYRDDLLITLVESPSTDERMRSIDLDIADQSGEVVYHEDGNTSRLADYGLTGMSWDGLTQLNDRLPEGTYTVTVTIVDSSNDEKIVTKDVLLDLAHWRERTWRRTIRAKATVIDRDLGRCGSLKRPARSAWPGSVGYRSRRCTSRRESYAATLNGVYLPRDPDFRWGTIRLNIFGGSARGRYRGSQAGYAYLTDEGEWLSGMTYDARVGHHKGLMQYGRHILGVEEGEPHFIWSVGTGGGQGYDIKSFTVVAGYTVFE